MKVRVRRATRIALATAVVGGALFAPASAVAVDGITVATSVIPADPQVQKFADCPSVEEYPEGIKPAACMAVKAYDGELKLGNVTATIDEPIEVMTGIGLDADGQPVLVPVAGADGGSGEPAAVKISGGILGIPELDPIMDAEPLGLLRLSATPQIGELGAESAGAPPHGLPEISLPLSIKLNNTLFGDNCQIGTPEEPFTVNLTTGTTSPPAGAEPMSGQPADGVLSGWWNYKVDNASPWVFPLEIFHASGKGALSVDNTFAVPGAKRCDLLPRELHGALEDGVDQVGSALGQSDLFAKTGLNKLVGKNAGLFDTVINSQAGLPSPAGENYVKIKVDVESVMHTVVAALHGAAGVEPFYAIEPTRPIDFGAVAVGESAVRTLTLSNPRATALGLTGATATRKNGGTSTTTGHEQFAIVGGSCTTAVTLQAGESCSADVRFAPTSPGPKGGTGVFRSTTGGTWFPSIGGFAGGHPRVAFNGTGE